MGAVMRIIESMGSPEFGDVALAHLNAWMPVSWWSVFRLHENRPPSMPTSGSYRHPNNTADSWKAYRESLYRNDLTFLEAKAQARYSPEMLVHWNAKEIPQHHRERIYTRHKLQERLSLVCRDHDDGLLAINLYRHVELKPFSDAEIDAIGSAAPLLLTCVRRHLDLPGVSTETNTALGILTRRERDVCERLLKGWTYEGIAADMGVSPGTVKTYRNRAFDRLGINHRNQLFALVNHPGVKPTDQPIKVDA